MRYTVYIFKCLVTGVHCIGVTNDLGAAIEKMTASNAGNRMISPDMVHLEQHDCMKYARYRLHQICSHWRRYIIDPEASAGDVYMLKPDVESYSRH